jgi:hypothetical protein
MPEISVDIEIYCAKCGAGICNSVQSQRKHNKEVFVVEPCDKCMETARDEGYEEGETHGYKAGVADAESSAPDVNHYKPQ